MNIFRIVVLPLRRQCPNKVSSRPGVWRRATARKEGRPSLATILLSVTCVIAPSTQYGPATGRSARTL